MTMWLHRATAVVGCLFLVTVGAGSGLAFGHGDDEVQSPAEAIESDLRAVADGNGWTVAQARAQDEAWKEVARVNRKVAAERRDIYIGAALSEKPGGAPSLYIKGPAPKFVRDLVAEASVPIKIVDEQPYSFDELEQRKMRVHEALVGMGFDEVATGINITGAGRLRPSVLKTSGLPTDLGAILEGVPADLRSSVVVKVKDRSYGDGDHSIGGVKVWNTQAPDYWCTSGWAVEHEPTGAKGIVSAGHCGEGPGTINRIHGTDPHVMDFQAEHLGNWGDVEWYTTDSTEQARFWGSPSELRDVMHREQIEDITIGRSLCLYGRASNQKNCTLEVDDPSQACTSGSTTLNHMVLMNGDIGEGGDSGGPWYWNNTAVGVHHGPCYTAFGDAFTPIDNLDRAHSLDVHVMVQE